MKLKLPPTVLAIALVCVPAEGASDTTKTDLASCQMEAWKVTGRQINPVMADGTLRFNKDAFDFYVLCMKAKGYEERNDIEMKGHCDVFPSIFCWEKAG